MRLSAPTPHGPYSDVFYDRSGTVIAVALTSLEPRAGFPLTLELRTPRPPGRTWVKTSQIRTLRAAMAVAAAPSRGI